METVSHQHAKASAICVLVLYVSHFITSQETMQYIFIKYIYVLTQTYFLQYCQLFTTFPFNLLLKNKKLQTVDSPKNYGIFLLGISHQQSEYHTRSLHCIISKPPSVTLLFSSVFLLYPHQNTISLLCLL